MKNLKTPRCFAAIEPLETRRLMHAGHDHEEIEPAGPQIAAGSGAITGYVVSDTNKDGKWSRDELGIAGREVWIDVNGDGDIDDTEPYAITASNGKYAFTGIGAGTYEIRQVLPDGWMQTNASSNGALIANLRDGQTLGGKDFLTIAGATPPAPTNGPESPPASNPSPAPVPPREPPVVVPPASGSATFTGYVVNDTNADGKWSRDEIGIANRIVYIDSNNNGGFDNGERSAITASNGKFIFSNIAGGTYALRTVLPNGWRQTNPANGAAMMVNVADGQTLGGRDFGVINDGTVTPPPAPAPIPTPTPTPPPSSGGTAVISGYVVNDTNKDGQWSRGEVGIAGRTVFIDANNNGQLDAGETSVTTANNGKFILSQLLAGTYTVREVLPSGWRQTNPGSNAAFVVTISTGQTIAGKDFKVVNDGTVTPPPAPPPTPTPAPPPPSTGVSSVSNWITRAPLPQARSEIFGDAIGGKLYTFGGYYDQTFAPTAGANVFDPATNSWKAIRSLPVPLTHTAHAADDRYMYFVGGYPGQAREGGALQEFATTDARFYDTKTDTYGTLPSLPVGRGSGALALLGRTLYFTGGTSDNRADQNDSYKLDLDNLSAGWKTFAPLPTDRNHPAAVALGGYVYFLTGQTDQDEALTTHNEMYRYDPATDTWAQMASLSVPRSHVTSSTFVVNGRIVTLGGEKRHLDVINNVDSYDPATDTWTRIGSMPDIGRYSGVAGLISPNTIVYTGGFTTYFRNTTWTATIA